MTAEASWLPDPAGRHQLRYHDGTAFTPYVCDNGVVGVDGDAVAADQAPAAEAGPAVVGFPPPEQGARAMDAAAPPTPTGYAPPPPTGYAPPPPLGYAPPLAGYGPPAPQAGPYWTGGAPALAGTRRHGGLIAVICVAAVEGIVIIALAVALVSAHTTTTSSSPQPIGSTVPASGSFSASMGSVVYSSKFAGSEQWLTGQLNDNTTASSSAGRYAITAWTDIHHPLMTPYDVPHRGISVDAATSAFSGGNVSMGAGCQSASGIQPALVYQLSVYPDGQWYIEEARLGGGVQVLDAGSATALGTTASVQLTCVMTDMSSDAEVTQLVAFVDGTRVAAIGHEVRGQAIGGFVPILLVGSLGPTVHVTFDAIVVRSIDPNSVKSDQTL